MERSRAVSSGGTRPEPPVVLQLTDPHLCADPEGSYDGVNTRASFGEVLAQACRSYPSAAALVLTGDLANDGSPTAYAALRRCLQGIEIPIYRLPGNHDDPAAMAEVLAGEPIKDAGSAQVGAWHCVFLSTYVAACEHGYLSDAELGRLAAELEAHAEIPTVIFMHHQPVPVGSPWLDRMGLQNADRFFAVSDGFPQVRAVLWGHVHQEFQSERRGVRLLGTPSTCVQFAPVSRCYQRDPRPPGYRWLKLWPDGRLATGVERIGSGPVPA